MKTKQLLHYLHDQEIVTAIAEAEAHTTGEIRVFISSKKPAHIEERARLRFHKLGMARTRDRNGVLIYLAPRIKQFAIIGDVAIHQKVGQGFWDGITSSLMRNFSRDRFNEGVLDVIHAIGHELAHHFPHNGEALERLPDEVLRD